MGRNRKRSTLANRAIVASAALILGGGGLVAVNTYASAGEGWSWSGQQNEQTQNQTKGAGQNVSTIDCPEVANDLPDVPEQARPEVDRELAAMDSQITDAYQKFADQKEQIEQDPQLANNAILNPLKDKRLASIDRISVSIGRAGQQPKGLDSLAPCALRPDDNVNAGEGDNGGDGQGDGQDGNGQDDGQDNGQDDGQNGGQDDGQGDEQGGQGG
ncbi:hypothetical protein HRW07_30810, partial [Streptomyces lunaelactis]|nr:hypothetical protein [Streptomyces lunaelactis]